MEENGLRTVSEDDHEPSCCSRAQPFGQSAEPACCITSGNDFIDTKGWHDSSWWLGNCFEGRYGWHRTASRTLAQPRSLLSSGVVSKVDMK